MNLVDSKDIKDMLYDTLRDNSSTDIFKEELDKPQIVRYRDLLFTIANKQLGTQYRLIRNLMSTFDVCITLAGAVLGYIMGTHDLSVETQTAVWVSYFAIGLVVAITVRVLPNDDERLRLEIARIKLVETCQRLGAKVALFQLLKDDKEFEDDLSLIGKISELVPQIDELDNDAVNTIRKCIQPSMHVVSSRETNIGISKLRISEAKREKLQEVLQQVVSVSRHLFDSYDFSAKLYLRVRKEYENNVVNLLVSFSRYPLKGEGGYGTSWVQARGNPSIVWQCLEKGDYLVQSKKDLGLYYDSVLAICLPKRVGVLAITSTHAGAFQRVDLPAYQLFSNLSFKIIQEILQD
jgi:hypothetical protein